MIISWYEINKVYTSGFISTIGIEYSKVFGISKLKTDQDIEGFRKLLLDGMSNGR